MKKVIAERILMFAPKGTQETKDLVGWATKGSPTSRWKQREMRYRRATTAGGSFSFTANAGRRDSGLLVRHIDDLRAVMRALSCWASFRQLNLREFYW